MLTVGEGDVGQLGLGPDTMERSRPGVVELPHKCIQVGHAYFFMPISELPQINHKNRTIWGYNPTWWIYNITYRIQFNMNWILAHFDFSIISYHGEIWKKSNDKQDLPSVK